MTEASGPTVFADAVADAIAEHGEGAVGDQAPDEGGENVGSTETGETTEPAATTETPPAQMVTVKVNGVETEIPLDEAINGYQRQQDYTSKTQELAAERERLAQAEAVIAALNEDPVGTLEWLREQFDVDENEPSFEDLDPVEQKIRQHDAFIQQQQEAQYEAEIRTEVDRIKAEYGDTELTFEDLLTHATERKIGNLDAAYRDLKFGSLYEDQQKAAKARRDAEDAAAEEAKRQAAVVNGGTSRTQGNTDTGGRPKTVQEAFAQAAKEHGVEL